MRNKPQHLFTCFIFALAIRQKIRANIVLEVEHKLFCIALWKKITEFRELVIMSIKVYFGENI